MNKKILLIVFLILILLNLYKVSAYDINEYLNEFSNGGETCEAIDIFEYYQWDPQWWNQNHFSQTIPLFYNCCKGDYCTNIIVDVKGKQLIKDDYYGELIDLNYIKYSLSEGDLTITSFVIQGIDSCYYHGGDELRKETFNLVADTAEKIALTQKTKRAKQVIDFVGTAKSLNLISPFNLVDFGLGVVCNYNNKKIKKAVEKLSECNLFLSNIHNNYAKTGYVYKLENCLDEAREDFKIYRQDKVAIVKHGTDKTLNLLQAIWQFVKNLFSNSGNAFSDFSVEDTEYAVAGKIFDEIKDKKLYLHNPDKQQIWDRYVDRITQKRSDYSSSDLAVRISYDYLKNITLHPIKIFITNLFLEPNYNMSGVDKVKKYYNYCQNLYSQVKYNSAINCLDELNKQLIEDKIIIERELKVPRSFDKRWVIGFVIFIIFVVIIGYITRKKLD